METPTRALPQKKAVAPAADNVAAAGCLSEMADLLLSQHDLPHRVAACRRAASAVLALRMSVRDLFGAAGPAALLELPGVEPWLARGIAELLAVGCWQSLERLRGRADPEALLCTLPGIDALQAAQLHDESGADTLDALDAALRSGRPSALQAGVAALAGRLRALRRACGEASVPVLAPVAALLEVDRRYRLLAGRGELPALLPQRCLPGGLSRVPVLHAERGAWHFTAMWENTARARRYGGLHDWVVIHAEHPSHPEQTSTVVTAAGGALRGRRVVRGREPECREHHVA